MFPTVCWGVDVEFAEAYPTWQHEEGCRDHENNFDKAESALHPSRCSEVR